jgi:putative DNA primase/helicase
MTEKKDANTIAREEGVEALREQFASAKPFQRCANASDANGNGSWNTTHLTAEETLVGALIQNSDLVTVVVAAGFEEKHLPRGGLRSCFRFAAGGSERIKQALASNYEGESYKVLERLAALNIRLSADQAKAKVQEIIEAGRWKGAGADTAARKANNSAQDHGAARATVPNAQTTAPAFTDDALALSFADEHANSLRYVAALGKWLLWDGTRWHFDETLIARDRARLICREASAKCSEPRTSKLVASAKTVRSIEHLSQADRRFAATIDQWDTNPWLINTPDGVVDLRNGQVRTHRPEDYLTKITAVAPDRSCRIPTWQNFLTRITANNTALIAYLQRMAGYALTGSTQEHALFFLYGLGANGKTTFLNAITQAAGDYHKTAPIETFTATNHDRHPTDLAGLRGARLVTATETEEGRRWAESKIKSLTGGDRIAARFMRQDFFEYTPTFKLVIAGNHKPGLRRVDEAIRRRFNLIPFAVTIPRAERDETLPDKLRAELPGILAWMCEGTSQWLKDGLAPPPIVTEATAAYLQAEDALGAWIDDRCIRDANTFTTSLVLFSSWSNWAEASGEYIGSLKQFIEALESHGFASTRKDYGRGFIGLKIRLDL